jgi:outer membrane protein TolC
LGKIKAVQREIFRDLEDALADFRKAAEKLGALERQVTSLKNYRYLAQLRDENGYRSSLEIHYVGGNLFSAESAGLC